MTGLNMKNLIRSSIFLILLFVSVAARADDWTCVGVIVGAPAAILALIVFAVMALFRRLHTFFYVIACGGLAGLLYLAFMLRYDAISCTERRGPETYAFFFVPLLAAIFLFAIVTWRYFRRASDT